MISSATKRATLRGFHLVLSIPVLGYIYEPAAEVQEYAGAVRLVFVPIIIFSGLCMYAGVVFALIGVAVWLGAYLLAGYGAAVGSFVMLFIAQKVWLMVRARRSK
ncbi:MAG: hypothetical protein ABI016_13430 [Chthoniobacterales bacterium]